MTGPGFGGSSIWGHVTTTSPSAKDTDGSTKKAATANTKAIGNSRRMVAKGIGFMGDSFKQVRFTY
jgi:hypothetical protein